MELDSLKDLHQNHFLPDYKRGTFANCLTPNEIIIGSDYTQIEVHLKKSDDGKSDFVYVVGEKPYCQNKLSSEKTYYHENDLNRLAAYRLESSEDIESSIVKFSNSKEGKTFFVQTTQTGQNSDGFRRIAIDIFEKPNSTRKTLPPRVPLPYY